MSILELIQIFNLILDDTTLWYNNIENFLLFNIFITEKIIIKYKFLTINDTETIVLLF